MINKQLLIDIGFKKIEDGGWDCDEVYYHEIANVHVFYGSGEVCQNINGGKASVADLINGVISRMEWDHETAVGEALAGEDW